MVGLLRDLQNAMHAGEMDVSAAASTLAVPGDATAARALGWYTAPATSANLEQVTDEQVRQILRASEVGACERDTSRHAADGTLRTAVGACGGRAASRRTQGPLQIRFANFIL